MGIAKYITNLDELKSKLEEAELKCSVDNSGLEDLLEQYFTDLIQAIGGGNVIPWPDAVSRSIGLHAYIPPLMFDFELRHTFDEDVLLSGVSYSQTGWKVLDRWSLFVDDRLLFDGLYTKELGEYKHFNKFQHVNAGETVVIVHHNNSGNSKQVWFDIDYIKKE